MQWMEPRLGPIRPRLGWQIERTNITSSQSLGAKNVWNYLDSGSQGGAEKPTRGKM
jgi:hypothetical protein